MHLHRTTTSQVLWSAILAAGLFLSIAPINALHAAENNSTIAGAFPAPPKGPGPGHLVKWQVDSDTPIVGQFGKAKTPSGNSFYIAYNSDRGSLYVPTVAGTTYVLNAKTLEPIAHIKTLPGGRVARISANKKVLLVLSGKALAIYSLADFKAKFTVPVGGNALAFDTEGRHVYVGGNMSKVVTEVSLQTGKITHRYPIVGSGDLAWADGKLFSANIKSGVMSVLNPATGKIVRIRTAEKDPAFSYHRIRAATAGFMQLAVSPDQDYVYAAGFSGNILKFAAKDGHYVGKIAVKAAPTTGANKLSGMVLVNKGQQAVVTIENRKEAALVQLSDGKILKLMPRMVSNRWVNLHGSD